MSIHSDKTTIKPFYQPYPSAFTIIERPVRWVNDIANRHANGKERGDIENKIDYVMNSIFDKMAFIKPTKDSYCCFIREFIWEELPSREKHYDRLKVQVINTFVYPILFVGSPVTMVADIVIGIAEIGFAAYKGCDNSDLKLIARMKLIASPAQHLILITINIVASVALVSSLKMTLYTKFQNNSKPFLDFVNKHYYKAMFILGGRFGSSYYLATQAIVSVLPDYFKPNGFNIFIDGGASDPNGIRYTDYCERLYEEFKREYNNRSSGGSQGVQNPQDRWLADLDQIINGVNLTKVEGDQLTPYQNFKNMVVDKKSPNELFKLADNFTKDDITSAYKKCAMLVHPDRHVNKPTEKEATELFKVCNTAKLILEYKLENK